MKLIENTYKHTEKGFTIRVTTCNKKLVTTEDIETKEIVKFNRGKFEWMVNKGIFNLVEQTDEVVMVKVIETEVYTDCTEIVDIFGQGCNSPTKKGVEGFDVTFKVDATNGSGETKTFTCHFQSVDRSDNMMAYNGYEMTPCNCYGCDDDETDDMNDFMGDLDDETDIVYDTAKKLCKEWLENNSED